MESSKTGRIQCGPGQSWDRNARLLERLFFLAKEKTGFNLYFKDCSVWK